jgi:hypothetical protein
MLDDGPCGAVLRLHAVDSMRSNDLSNECRATSRFAVSDAGVWTYHVQATAVCPRVHHG